MRINLTKKDLVNTIYMQVGFSKQIIENLVEEFFSIIVSNLIKKEMEQANLPLFPLNIPIVVDFGEADNWSEAH